MRDYPESQRFVESVKTRLKPNRLSIGSVRIESMMAWLCMKPTLQNCPARRDRSHDTSVDCDIDHTRRWVDGGATCPCNTAPLCCRHHRTKDTYDWRYPPVDDNDSQWTSRLGHTCTTSG